MYCRELSARLFTHRSLFRHAVPLATISQNFPSCPVSFWPAFGLVFSATQVPNGSSTTVEHPFILRDFSSREKRQSMMLTIHFFFSWVYVSSSMRQCIIALSPSFRTAPNHLPASANITSAGLGCYVLFWVLQLPFLLIHPTKIKLSVSSLLYDTSTDSSPRTETI